MTTNLFEDTDFVTIDLYNKIIISPTVLFPQVVILNNKN